MKHVLYSFDGPKMVIALDERGRQVLGVAAGGDTDGTTRWLFAPASSDRMLELLKTRVGLRTLFEVGPVDVYDVARLGESARAWLSLTAADVPEELFSDVDAELPELTEETRARIIGEQEAVTLARVEGPATE